MTSEPIKPDYAGGCLTRVIPTLLARASVPWMPAVVGDASAVVLLVLDGLGWGSLLENEQRAPVLRSMEGGSITTVLPSSTASALTSLTTGVAPSEHGITGIVVQVDGDRLHTLRWSAHDRPVAPAPDRVQPVTPFAGRPVPVVTRAEFIGSGFTDAHLRGARLTGWRTTSMLVHDTARLIDEGEPFVYAYYDGIDLVAHTLGTSSRLYAREVGYVDALVDEMLRSLPPSVALVVSADHGQVELEDDAWIDTETLAPMIAAYAGDARCRFLYARAGAAHELLAAAAELAGDRAWVLDRAQALEDGWFGPVTPLAEQRIGDVVLLGRDAAFADPLWRGERSLRTVHGSATVAEMLVPLLAARGRRVGG